jgi:hypothetical protein
MQNYEQDTSSMLKKVEHYERGKNNSTTEAMASTYKAAYTPAAARGHMTDRSSRGFIGETMT